jgi:ParE toxin of type II toxin-antitoxin system, parDE
MESRACDVGTSDQLGQVRIADAFCGNLACAAVRHASRQHVGARNYLRLAARAIEMPKLVGTREQAVRPNYIVVYRVTGEQVEILRVRHARKRDAS